MEKLKEVYKKLLYECHDGLAYPFDELIDEIGFEGVYLLSEKFGGTNIYIPKFRRIFKEQIDRAIRDEFDGGNYVQLALKYGLCERTIRNIVNKK